MFMSNFRYLVLALLMTHTSNAQELTNLSLDNALKIMRENNLELKISKFNEQIKHYESKVTQGMSYGKLDAKIQALRSNDAGNVFGFKVKSREATFGDFGFTTSGFGELQNIMGAGGEIAGGEPQALNYPDARNHYQTTISYMLPLYTGGKLEQYQKITKSLQKMSQLDSAKLLNEKIFQTTKTFYDISLINQYISNLTNISSNIEKLQNIVKNMREEGFAKEIDELEVETRKVEAQSMLSQAQYNKELAYQYLSFLLNKNVISIQSQTDTIPMPEINQEAFLRDNLEIQKAKLGLEISKMALKAEKANFLPNVGAFTEYGSSDNKPFNEFADKDFYT
ncbi:MAG TPA: TolC family protein, partial [Campylobacterales bacterium]|nr:TolC family protein [Campylobacterales bacterium]